MGAEVTYWEAIHSHEYTLIYNLYYGFCCFLAGYLLVFHTGREFFYKNNLAINFAKLITLLYLAIPVFHYVLRGAKTYAYIEIYADGAFLGPMSVLVSLAFIFKKNPNEIQRQKSKRVLLQLYLSIGINLIFAIFALLSILSGNG